MALPETRTYEIVTTRGKQRVTVPESYKITFGAVVPGSKANGYGGGWGLRIWETADKQRAVFSDVISFRDLSIPIEVAAVRKFGSDEWIADDGTWVGKNAELVEKGWMSIDRIGSAPSNLDDDEPETINNAWTTYPSTRKRA